MSAYPIQIETKIEHTFKYNYNVFYNDWSLQTVDELFKLMQLFVKTYPDSTDQELAEVREFRRQTLQLYIQVLRVTVLEIS